MVCNKGFRREGIDARLRKSWADSTRESQRDSIIQPRVGPHGGTTLGRS